MLVFGTPMSSSDTHELPAPPVPLSPEERALLIGPFSGPPFDSALTRDETQAVKTWIALNCPLWPDYLFRPERKALAQMRAGE